MPTAARTDSPRTKGFAPARSTDSRIQPEAMYPERVAGTSPAKRKSKLSGGRVLHTRAVNSVATTRPANANPSPVNSMASRSRKAIQEDWYDARSHQWARNEGRVDEEDQRRSNRSETGPHRCLGAGSEGDQRKDREGLSGFERKRQRNLHSLCSSSLSGDCATLPLGS